MAQNEGRTRRRAPKSFLAQLTLFVVMLMVSLAFGLVVHELKAAAESALIAETSAKTTPTTNLGADAGQNSAPGQVAAAQSANDAAEVSQCTPANYRLPTPISLTDLPVGVTTITDSTQHYTIFGDTAGQRLEQLQQCAPGGEFAGAASYQMTWQYGYSLRADGLCQIVQPKIGLHLTMIMPTWKSGIGASQQDRAVWNNYISALELHERGHYSISKRYANAMLAVLEDLPAQSCGAIKSSADTLLQSKLAQLNAAQSNYDTTTNHGATQGAVL